ARSRPGAKVGVGAAKSPRNMGAPCLVFGLGVIHRLDFSDIPLHDDPSTTLRSSHSRINRNIDMSIPVTFQTNKDARVLASLVVLFVFFLIVSWQRWTRPLVDHGREMNLPARVLAGEQLYVDILYYYGPFAPHFNALLYRIFGLHLA